MQSTETRTEVLLLYAVLAIATTPTAAKTSPFKGLLLFSCLVAIFSNSLKIGRRRRRVF